MVKDRVEGVEVHGSSPGKVFFDFFMDCLYPAVTVLLGYFDSVNYTCLVFAL